MDNTTPNPSGMMNGMPPVIKEEKKIGPIFGVLIIVLVLIIGALYFFSQRMSTSPVVEDSIAPAETMQASAVQSNDDTDTLDAELEAELSNVEYSF